MKTYTKFSKRCFSLILAFILTLGLSSQSFTVFAAREVTYPQFLMTVDACAEETSSEPDAMVNAIDGSSSTFWHTPWDASKHPQSAHDNTGSPYFKAGVVNGHWLEVDLGSVQTIAAIRYLTRPSGNTNGNISACTIYVSTDHVTWTQAGSASGWATSTGEKRINFTTASSGRWVLMVATSPTAYVNCGEFNVEVTTEDKQADIFEYANVAVGKAKAVTIGTSIKNYRKADQEVCINGIKALCFSEDSLDNIKTAMDLLVKTFLDNPIHYPESVILDLLSKANTMKAGLAVGVGDGNVSQTIYDNLETTLNAVNVLYSGGKTQDIEMDNAYEALLAAYNNTNALLLARGDLLALINKCNAYKAGLGVGIGDRNVTQAAYDTFAIAIVTAETAYVNSGFTTATINSAVTALSTAFNTIDALVNARNALLNCINKCDNYLASLTIGTDDNGVTQAAYDIFAAAITAARAYYAQTDFTTAGLNSATATLEAAYYEISISAKVVLPNLTDGKLPAYNLAVNIDPDAIRFNNEEWTGNTSVAPGKPNQGRQSQVFEINRERPHTDTLPYSTVEKAIKGAKDYDKASSDLYMPLTTAADLNPLTSSWKFSIVKTLTKDLTTANFVKDPLNPSRNIVDFYKSDYDISQWNSIAVPSNWNVQGIGADGKPYTGYYDPAHGYDPPYYTNISMPGSLTVNDVKYNIFNGVSIPGAPNDYNPVGFYRKDFDVPADWIANKNKVFISFEGVEAAFYVYLNGKEVGYHEDRATPGEFDLTPFLTADGKNNKLAVKVFRWADCSWMDDQDFNRLGGIFRDVYLRATPAIHIRDYKIETYFDSTFENATLKLRANVKNYSADQNFSNYNVLMQLYDANGVNVLSNNAIKLSLFGLTANKELVVSGETSVLSPHKWFPDDPYLYTLVLTVYDKSTNIAVEHISQQFGFKQVTFRTETNASTIIRINGEKVTMRGVNRHDTTPYGGHYVSKETYETDLKIMKRYNINTIRTAHYPDDEYLYYLADKYGILIVAEANNESHANTSSSISVNNFFALANYRVINEAERNKNRTSVFMWSLGNESGSQAGFRDIIQNLRAVDPTRPVHYEALADRNNSSQGDRAVDVYSRMYSTVSNTQNDAANASTGSSMLCEYAHAMGNSVGNLKEYMDVFRSQAKSIGGCIWEYVEHNTWTIPNKTDDMKLDYYGNGMYLAYGGDWGEGNHDNAFCSDGLLDADRSIQPEMEEVKKVYSPLVFTASDADLNEGTINVRNENYAKNVNEYDIRWTLTENGKVLDSQWLANVPSIPAPKGHDILINIPTAKISLPYLASMPETLRPGAEYFVKIEASLKQDTEWASAGYVLCEEQFKLPVKSDEEVTTIKIVPAKISVNDGDDKIAVAGKNFSLSIDKTDGLIKNYIASGVLLLSEGPRPNFGRANLDNGNASSNWTNVYANLPVPAISVETLDGGLFVRVTVSYNATAVSSTSWVDMTYTVGSNGAVNVVMATRGSGAVNRIGTDLRMPSGFENVEWLTRGPLENLNDRVTGAFVGQYKTTASDNFYPYAKPQDTGTHQETRWMALTGDDKDMGLLVAATGTRNFEASALHYTWRDLTGKRHPKALEPLPETIVSVNYGSRGTGGASCGPDTLSQYQLSVSNTVNCSYTFVPFATGDDIQDIADHYRAAPTFGDRVNISMDDRVIIIPIDVDDSWPEKPSFEVTAENDITFSLLVAAYDSDGSLINVDTSPMTLKADSTETLSAALSGVENAAKLKFFIWDENYLPLTAITSADGLK